VAKTIYPSASHNPVDTFPKLKPNSRIWLLAELVPCNKIMVKGHGPIPSQVLILIILGRAKYHSTIDLADWYFQIRVEPECEKYNTIITPFGFFACKVILQEDTNAPATAMRVIHYVLQDFIRKFMSVYLDDISIYSDTLADHIGHIQAVCQCLQEHKIIVSPKNCNFFAKKVNLLGHYIDEKGVHRDSEKF
jgi:hypothetical protein